MITWTDGPWLRRGVLFLLALLMTAPPVLSAESGKQRVKALKAIEEYFEAAEELVAYYDESGCHARCASYLGGPSFRHETFESRRRFGGTKRLDRPEGFPRFQDRACRRAVDRWWERQVELSGTQWVGFNCKVKSEFGDVMRYAGLDRRVKSSVREGRMREMDSLVQQRFEKLRVEHPANVMIPMLVDDWLLSRRAFTRFLFDELEGWRARVSPPIAYSEIPDPSWRFIEWSRRARLSEAESNVPPIRTEDLEVHSWGARMKRDCGLVFESPEEILGVLKKAEESGAREARDGPKMGETVWPPSYPSH